MIGALTVEEAARYLGITRGGVQAALRAGHFPSATKRRQRRGAPRWYLSPFEVVAYREKMAADDWAGSHARSA